MLLWVVTTNLMAMLIEPVRQVRYSKQNLAGCVKIPTPGGLAMWVLIKSSPWLPTSGVLVLPWDFTCLVFPCGCGFLTAIITFVV
jgi:hypothetical protein